MDVLFFLQSRTRFIRQFYELASFGITERKRKIEVGEEPFVPGYSEDPEPPFTSEWIEAEESLDVLGQACVSMLSSTLQLFFKEWVAEMEGRYGEEQLRKAGIQLPKERGKTFREGWIKGYREFFQEQLRIDWSDVPSNLGLLEEIVLTRNSAQHPDSITSFRIEQSRNHAEKFPKTFFADELELKMFGDGTDDLDYLRPWRLNVTGEKLMAATNEVDNFCMWLDERLRAWPPR